MIAFFQELETNLLLEFKNIESSIFTPCTRFEKMAKASISSYLLLKEKLKSHQFPDHESEIHFFRNINPVAISKIHFYSLIIKHIGIIESYNIPKERKAYCKRMLKHISLYNTNNQHIIIYYKSSGCNLDEKYFLRSNSDFPFVLEDCLALLDKETSTGYDLIIARYLAYCQYSEYILTELHGIEQKIKTPNLGTGSVFLPWTGSKIELIELMYALHAKGSISNGQIPVNELAKFFEAVFNTELGDFYRTFNEIKHRNKQTLFIDNLRKAFVEKASEKDF